MLTEFGKICRKIRIDSGEIMADMAEKLNVTASFLSAVEHGKKPVPKDWPNLISDRYNLSLDTQKKLISKAAESIKQVRINVDDTQKDFVVAFARNFEKLSDEDRKTIMELLKK